MLQYANKDEVYNKYIFCFLAAVNNFDSIKSPNMFQWNYRYTFIREPYDSEIINFMKALFSYEVNTEFNLYGDRMDEIFQGFGYKAFISNNLHLLVNDIVENTSNEVPVAGIHKLANAIPITQGHALINSSFAGLIGTINEFFSILMENNISKQNSQRKDHCVEKVENYCKIIRETITQINIRLDMEKRIIENLADTLLDIVPWYPGTEIFEGLIGTALIEVLEATYSNMKPNMSILREKYNQHINRCKGRWFGRQSAEEWTVGQDAILNEINDFKDKFFK
jgi:hypothetical protein